MEEHNRQNEEVIDLLEVARKIFSRKKLFLKVWVATFVLSCIWILPQPRSYVSTTSMAPEMVDVSQLGGLGSLASSFGFNLGGNQSSDAFYPDLYPEVIATNEFIVGLFDVEVSTLETEDAPSVESDYLTHITRDQKKNMLTLPFNAAMKWVRSLFGDKKSPIGEGGGINPMQLSREEEDLVDKVRNSVTCDVDKRTSVITINVEDQDPLVAAQLADSVRCRLQDFIIDYRTSKARIDLDYYKSLADSAQLAYQEAVQNYSDYCDMHTNVILQSYISERDMLENEMATRLTAFNAMSTQYEAAKAKMQERVPAFTILSRPSVANRAAKPKRMLFVLAMLFLATGVTCAYIFKKEMAEQLRHVK